MSWPLAVNIILSALGFIGTLKALPRLRDMFIAANLFGVDLNKSDQRKIPEAAGVISSCIFLIVMFLFIPWPFSDSNRKSFPYQEFVEFVAALLSICCMILLGFADDVLNLKWRHKLLLPTMASLPLLMVYYVNFNSTTVIVPKPLRALLGPDLDLGLAYYVYMGMLAVFCTNAINIYAGVNGLEVGQSVVVAASIIVYNVIELGGDCRRSHLFSLYFMVPYLATSLALLYHNWYPARVFVGDTFCYFSGMTLAVVAILGHFSKTALLFLVPQIANFVLSLPQLLHLVPCPRHRLPRLEPAADGIQQRRLRASVFQYEERNVSKLGLTLLELLRRLRLVDITSERRDEGTTVHCCTNLTLINVWLTWFGPCHERRLTGQLLGLQVACTLLAMVVRYPLASLFY